MPSQNSKDEMHPVPPMDFQEHLGCTPLPQSLSAPSSLLVIGFSCSRIDEGVNKLPFAHHRSQRASCLAPQP
eukprot:1771359-Amphidinium_carterae.1